AAIIGGGPRLRPGEASLALHGVLLLDELAEFQRSTLEALRQPLEDGEILVARAAGSARFPARFQLIGTMNLCPCGARGDPGARSSCSAQGPPGAPFASAARPVRHRRHRSTTACDRARDAARRGVEAGPRSRCVSTN